MSSFDECLDDMCRVFVKGYGVVEGRFHSEHTMGHVVWTPLNIFLNSLSGIVGWLILLAMSLGRNLFGYRVTGLPPAAPSGPWAAQEEIV